MKVVCLKTLREARSPYERNPHCPPSGDDLLDISPWRLRLPLQHGQPWATVDSPIKLPTWEWSPEHELQDARERLARRRALKESQGEAAMKQETQPPHLDERQHAGEGSSGDGYSSRITPSAGGTTGLLIITAFHKLRKHGMEMKCFKSEGGHPIPAPPTVPGAHEHDLYLHEHTDGIQVWRASSDDSWVPATEDMAHPKYPQYRLHISTDNWPRWLLKKTISTYKSRQGRKLPKHSSAPNVLSSSR